MTEHFALVYDTCTMPAITTTFVTNTRAEWRAWLSANHATAKEIWLVTPRPSSGLAHIPYLEAVEEALCFGWIDGIAKRFDDTQTAQRFTPRRPKSNWTELNKERARRLIAHGLMTESGRATLPDLTVRPLVIAPDIAAALARDPAVWQTFQSFDAIYQRVRIDLIEEQRKTPAEFEKRLSALIEMTRAGKQFKMLL
jgi:uncharacterized protein YdeI (YjbR/CyaY-like superfamily)